MKTADKLSGRNGIAAAIVVLAILVLLLAVAVLIPVYRNYRYQAQEVGCVSALKSANDQLSIETISAGAVTADQAKAVVTRAMNGWDDLCPGGGTPYLVENHGEGAPWLVVCGLHDRDTKERTRLNASYALEQLRRVIDREQRQGNPEPTEISVVLNGNTYQAVQTDREMGLKRGTASTMDVADTVIYYALAGQDGFGAELPAGSICYFSFADEEHCANWRSGEGWTGDSYE